MCFKCDFFSKHITYFVFGVVFASVCMLFEPLESKHEKLKLV